MSDNPENKPGVFGAKSEQDKIEAQNRINEVNRSPYRIMPLEYLKYKDISEMRSEEQLPVQETLKGLILEGQLGLATRVEKSIEGFDYQKVYYSVLGDVERASQRVTQITETLQDVKEGENERLLGLTQKELIRNESATRIFSWALPYKARSWDGMGSLALLAERGEQLSMGHLDRFLNGTKAGWVDTALDPHQFPEKEVEKWNKVGEFLPLVENGETVSDRLARYTADADFWQRIVGEMITYNPTVKDEKLNISETMQVVVGSLMKRMPRTLEDGTPEDFLHENILRGGKEEENKDYKNRTYKITVWLDGNGDQVLQDAGKNPVDTNGDPIVDRKGLTPPKEAYINLMDYYNNGSRSENETRWVVAITSALAIHNAKAVLDSLPHNVVSVLNDKDNKDAMVYNELFRMVQATAQNMVENFDVPRKKDLNITLARSGFCMADAIAFGSFSIADRGWNYDWTRVAVYDPKDKEKPKDQQKILGYKWNAEPQQGDPTASGDAFTARYPVFHEIAYQALKNRVSNFNSGMSVPVNPKDATEVLTAIVSEAAEINSRGKMIKIISEGKQQQHLAKYFGILGAFKNELGHLPEWKAGEAKRISLGKKVNENLSKTVEETVLFTPTPFKNEIDGNLVYPLLEPQFPISLFDMLSDGKNESVGSLLRKTWIKGENGSLTEATLEQGGKRLTMQDIDFLQYARYADNGRAVNNNFILQVYAPLYGQLNPKYLETVKVSPMAEITAKIKALDIGTRSVIKKLKDGTKAERASFEIMYGASIAFQELALGINGVIGRGAISRYQHLIEDISPSQRGARSDNLYLTLRTVEDFLPKKGGYGDYSDSFFCVFLAQAEAIKPITEASDNMAYATTKRFRDRDITGTIDWRKKVTESDRNHN